MAFNILRVIWLMLHMFYNLLQHVVFISMSIRKKCEKLFNLDTMPVTEDIGFMAISKHAKMLAKVPAHVAVIVGEETISVHDLANVTIWCIAAGISCLSFYDYNGLMKKLDSDLCLAIAKLGKLGTLCLNKINWANTRPASLPSCVSVMNGNGTNGYNIQRLTVNIFSLNDSKKNLVQVTKNLHSMVSANDLKISDINVKLVNSMLQSSLSIPEVNLSICCSKTLSTYGFLPWHTRVTEFTQLSSHHNIRQQDFMSILDNYSKCNQRFGK